MILSGAYSARMEIILYKDIIYFTYFGKAINNFGMYRTDGSINGTKLLFEAKSESYTFDVPINITPLKDYLYFTYSGDCVGEELYKFPITSFVNDKTPDFGKETIKIYPNPVTDELHLTFLDYSISEDILIEIYDFSGQKVFSKKVNTEIKTFDIDTNNLKSGAYVLKTKDNKGLFSSKKFIKI